jgi:small subunit ribosomal protein S20
MNLPKKFFYELVILVFFTIEYCNTKKIFFLKKMNKKQKNRKQVTQNKRNRIINKRYVSTIKTLVKLFLNKKKMIETVDNSVINSSLNTSSPEHKIELKNILNNIYSIIDKAVKKNVLHKNTAARKKARVGKLFVKMV